MFAASSQSLIFLPNFWICIGVSKGSDFGTQRFWHFRDYFSHFEFSSPVFSSALLQTRVYSTVLEISNCIHIKYFSAASNENPTDKWEIKYLCIPKLDGSWHGLSGSYLSRLSFQQILWPFPNGFKRAATISCSRREGGRGDQTHGSRLCYMAIVSTRSLEGASFSHVTVSAVTPQWHIGF